MWRDILREILIHVRLVDRPTYTLRFVQRHPTPDQVPLGEIIVVQAQSHLKWACFRCPGGCSGRFQLSLHPSRRPRWTVSADWLNRPSIDPSVHQSTGCGAHFWIRSGGVVWCKDSKCEKEKDIVRSGDHFF